MVKIKWFAAAGLALALNGPALAENCANTTWTALAATACLGSFVGNSGSGSTVPDELLFLNAQWPGFAPFSFAGKSDDTDSGPFTSNPTVALDGTLTFDAPMTMPFVISLKAADQYSYYLFNPLGPVSSLTFNSTAGVSVNANDLPNALSHASLFTSPVPEPSALLLAALGLPALWLATRRRRQDA
jgi:hypothetical protein